MSGPDPEFREGRAVWVGIARGPRTAPGCGVSWTQWAGTEAVGLGIQEKEGILVGMVGSGSCGRPETPGE